jgi:phospholipid N-methyltransferase
MSLKTFVEEALNDFHTVAAVSPSSKYLAAAMLEPLPLSRARVAVEFGAGTGVITHAMLAQMPRKSQLFVFEINTRFYDCLRSTISDPRVVLINASVETLDVELSKRGVHHVDAIASSLGLAFMSEPERHALFQRLSFFLHSRSVFTQYQYIHGLQFGNGRLSRFDMRPLLSRYFGTVDCKIEWRNFPPAFVFTCRAHPTHPEFVMKLPSSVS